MRFGFLCASASLRYQQFLHLAYWVSEPDRGQSHASNKGFARATGEIFGWLIDSVHELVGTKRKARRS